MRAETDPCLLADFERRGEYRAMASRLRTADSAARAAENAKRPNHHEWMPFELTKCND